VIANCESFYFCAELDDTAGTFMAEDGRINAAGVAAVNGR
jgi:hypothetical protein